MEIVAAVAKVLLLPPFGLFLLIAVNAGVKVQHWPE